MHITISPCWIHTQLKDDTVIDAITEEHLRPCIYRKAQKNKDADIYYRHLHSCGAYFNLRAAVLCGTKDKLVRKARRGTVLGILCGYGVNRTN